MKTIFSCFSFFLVFSLLEKAFSILRVDSPNDLRKKFPGGEIQINVATFGDIPYGMSLYGPIFYDIDNKDAEMACSPLTTINIPSTSSFSESSAIVMLDRGSCSFVTKARNAQAIGAKAAIIINNNDDNIENIYMIDDGSGQDISIPTVLISKEDGEVIKKYLRDNRKEFDSYRPHFVLEFELEKSTVINFEIIMSSTNLEIYQLLNELKDALNAFEDTQLNFYPIYYIQSHPEYIPFHRREKDTVVKDIKTPDCYGNGRYCYFFDSEALDLNVYEGQSVLKEDLRQICIFKERRTPNITDYIDYTSAFYGSCLNATKPTFTDECSRVAMKEIGYTEDKIQEIEKCIIDSFDEKDSSLWYKSENQILHKERKFLKRMHVIINPSIIVNRKLIYGRRTLHNILEAICSAYTGKMPEPCYNFHIYARMVPVPDSSSAGLSGKMVVFIVISVIFLNIIIILGCREYMKRKMKARMESDTLDDKISSAVTSYMALRDKH